MIFHARIEHERIPAQPMQIIDHASFDGLVNPATIIDNIVVLGPGISGMKNRRMKIGVMQCDDGSA
jgi:hypothetical protein